MKFITSDVSKDVIKITTEVDEEGDVKVMANGVNLLWVMTHGSVYTDDSHDDKLKALGFNLHDGGGVKIV